jgi:hypothetical protein
MAVQVERPWDFMTKGLDFALGLWKLRIVPVRRLQFLYCIAYFFFQPISLDSQQSLAIQSHGLSTNVRGEPVSSIMAAAGRLVL